MEGLKDFPLFVASDCHTIQGYVCIESKFFWVSIRFNPTDDHSIPRLELTCSPELTQILQNYREILQQRAHNCRSLNDFLCEFKEVVDRVTGSSAGVLKPNCTFYQQLVKEIDAVGWSLVDYLAEDCSQIAFKLQDAAGREHLLSLSLPPSYPYTAPSATTDLPVPFHVNWDSGSGLGDVLSQFKEVCQSCEDLWACLDDLDAHTWVLEPALHGGATARRSDCHRRLALGGHSSLTLTLSAARPHALPCDVRFLGAPQRVAALQQAYYANAHLWQEDRLPRHNLEALLHMTLPGPAAAELDPDDLSADCAICYAYYLPDERGSPGQPGGSVPEVSCAHPPCSRPYHSRCLAEWLRALTDTTAAFDRLFGHCPYCSSAISVKSAPTT